MIVRKRVQGHIIELEYKYIKNYGRFNLYEVYKGNELLYKTCLDMIQIKNIICNDYNLNFEVIG